MRDGSNCLMVHGGKGLTEAEKELGGGLTFNANQAGWISGASRIEAEEHDQGEDHQLGVKQDEDAGMVEAPFAAKAPGCVDHSPNGYRQDKVLPVRAV